MKNLNFTVLTSTVLIFAALTGSGILTLNAEFLLAVCFLIFVLYFYSNLSENLIEPLEEQSNAIQKEFEQYYNKYENMLKTLVSYHERRVILVDELKQIASFSQKELSYLVDKREKSFAQEISHQITQKLKTLELKDQEIYKDIQEQATSHFTDQVLTFFKKGGESNYSKDILVQEAINNINKISNKKPQQYFLSKSLKNKLRNLLTINTVTNISLPFLLMKLAQVKN